MSGKEQQKLLTVRQVADYTGENIFTVYRKIEAGIYPAVRLSNSPTGPLRVPERDLEEFIFADEGQRA